MQKVGESKTCCLGAPLASQQSRKTHVKGKFWEKGEGFRQKYARGVIATDVSKGLPFRRFLQRGRKEFAEKIRFLLNSVNGTYMVVLQYVYQIRRNQKTIKVGGGKKEIDQGGLRSMENNYLSVQERGQH